MLFSEPVFLFICLPLLLALYFAPGLGRFRNLILLAFSLLFYAWGEKVFVFLMLASIVFNHVMGLAVARAQTAGRTGKGELIFAVVGNLLFLGVYKYADLFVGTLNVGLAAVGIAPLALPGIRLPIGISFFTFQAMSYVIDVYRKDTPVEKKLTNVALYVALFPQLIAGPIVRYTDVAREMVQRTITRPMFAEGVRRFILGLGKKMILANTAAMVADQIFGNMNADPAFAGVPAEHLTASIAWLGILCYSLQIYFDFSAYSDMAIGLGLMFGFRFLENFNYPYISQSITEFWRRWHISLSTWFRDYLYIPLGGNRGSSFQTYRNLFIVFFLCGLWHGASWTFVIWGLYHGMFLIVERIGLGRVIANTWRPLRHAYTLLAVIIGWLFFRAETLPQAGAFLHAMVGLGTGDGGQYRFTQFIDNQVILAIILGIIGSMPLWPTLGAWYEESTNGLTGSRALWTEIFGQTGRLAVLMIVFVIASLLVAAGSYNPFIYFRF